VSTASKELIAAMLQQRSEPLETKEEAAASVPEAAPPTPAQVPEAAPVAQGDVHSQASQIVTNLGEHISYEPHAAVQGVSNLVHAPRKTYRDV
jgi:hypothetical protein